VDVGGGAGAEHLQAEEVESGGAGDHAAVVADVAGTVKHGDVEPGVVGAEARGPQDRGDLPAGEVQLDGGAGVDVGGCERVWWRELVVEACGCGPLVEQPGSGTGSSSGRLGRRC
jgi:hypothetical protein